MKKFNIDELIWFIILILLDLSIVFLIRSGNISNFVSSDMIIYFYLSIIILSIFAVFQFGRIFTIKRRVETTNKFIPLTFTLCIGVVLLYLFPLLKGNENINENLLLKNHTDAIIINSDNYDILNKIVEHKEEYEGKDILFLGYIDKDKEGSDFMIISRQMIKCCQADKEKIQIKAKGIESNLKEGQWINIYGKICFDNDFYILVEEYKLQDEPNDIYFHEHLLRLVLLKENCYYISYETLKSSIIKTQRRDELMELPKIKVADFEGPFDLLLHLIKKNKMDIYNVEIYKVTNQYLEYLNTRKVMDLEITSEFIVVAATLIEIKSKNLLPKIKVEEEENEEDIEKRLMEKLIEYKKIKSVSEFFKERYINQGDVYSKKPEIIEEVKSEPVNNVDIFKNITLLDLYNIYNKILENYREKQNKFNVVQKKIYVDKYKVEDKMNELLERVNSNKVIEFEDLMKESSCKLETVVTFLALLELIKIRTINVYQDESFGNILIKRRRDSE